MLAAIERATRQKIEKLALPTTDMVNNKRIADFKQGISDTLAGGQLEFMRGILEQYQHEHDVPSLDIAAALAKLAIGENPLLLEDKPPREQASRPVRESMRKSAREPAERSQKGTRRKGPEKPAEGMERFRIEVGRVHEVKPGNIVGAIANEAGLDGEHIGHIEIHETFCLVDLPTGMPKDVFNELKKVRVCGEALNISRLATHMQQQSVRKTAGQVRKRK
jgi:ATP-dependent RNA helicase DeaD